MYVCTYVCACACVPGGETCPAAAVAMAKAEAGETEQRKFSPDWTEDTQTHNYHQRTGIINIWINFILKNHNCTCKNAPIIFLRSFTVIPLKEQAH